MGKLMEEHKAADEKRSEPRYTVRKGGRVICSDGTTVDCTIRDASAKGARLEFQHSAFLPDQFILQIGSGDLIKGRVPCKTKWSRARTAGVELQEPFDIVPKWKTSQFKV